MHTAPAGDAAPARTGPGQVRKQQQQQQRPPSPCQSSPNCLQVSLLVLGTDLLAAHVLPHCSLRDLAALSAACRCLRALTAGLPEAAWAAAARRLLPPTHPVCISSNVRAALARQQRLAASLADFTGWAMDDPWPHDQQHPDLWQLCPDFKLVALALSAAVDVREWATCRAVARLELPAAKDTDKKIAWSSSSSFVAVALDPGRRSELEVALLCVASGAQQLVANGLCGCLVSQAQWRSVSLEWAPSADMLCLTIPDREPWRLIVLSSDGAVLAEIYGPGDGRLQLAWSPSSRFLGCAAEGYLHCLDQPLEQWHWSPPVSQIRRQWNLPWVWLPCASELPELAVLCQPYKVLLLAAPELSEVGSQHVPFEPTFLACGVDVLALVDVMSRSLWLYRLNRSVHAGQPFLQAVCKLPHPARATGPVLSPSGTCMARVLPNSYGTTRLEVLTLSGQTTERVVSSVRTPCWSADGCSVALAGARLDTLRVLRLLPSS